ncbi:YmaF family protein [Faecalicatena contorta]|uniref:YmaF family protein n=1 Tax=Lachnospiraceae TaxID=186803 RepID=UPI002286B8B1|nr:YmaF family protein [Faecalicatena contorta]MCF2668349.1 hypothetical protein [Faecalicatena contorta]
METTGYSQKCSRKRKESHRLNIGESSWWQEKSEPVILIPFSDEYFHEFCGKTTGAIDVGNGKHVHFIKDCTEEEDNHKHEFQAATLIDSPTDFKCK